MINQPAINRQEITTDFDFYLIWSALVLLSLGLVMVYSASIAIAESEYGESGSYYYLIRHSIYLFVGLVIGFFAFQFPMRTWREYCPYLFLVGTILLILVLIPGIGREINGSQRWIPLGIVNFQPSELMKLLMVIYASDYVVRKLAYLDNWRKGVLPIVALISAVGFLLLREPDYGAFVVVTGIAVAIMFMGGMSLKLFIGVTGLLVACLSLLIISVSYRSSRIDGFLDPWADPYGKGYQLSHALIAFGRGEWFGVGLGGSVEKLFYLPEAHTDFMFAVLAEELGFVGVATVMAMFTCILVRAFSIGRTAAILENYFSALVAQGIGVWLGFQAFINMGVNMGVLPTKGLTLPLMSFGGSSIVVTCIALAVLLRIDWENRQKIKGLNV
ncbi:putative lipid II flippase FtsW [Nitrosomonas communis]|uniref:Probable peptidoglycan glycosyltransferase FtsW n=1 Tax=Nitrosomonas communis TaxID=44574 RepID=A0A1H2TK66_9PROT|nr:putative lipid II flippase FtsW [Nitrosomonas communis]SDW44200.1 cell division protein FtsW [Nitrosomonas communis]